MHRFGDRMRELRWLAVGAVIGLPTPALLLLTVVSVPAGLAAGLGIGLFAMAVWATRRLAGAQRRRVGVATPYRLLPTRMTGRLAVVLRDPGTWRDVAWLPVQFLLGLFGLVLPVTLWLGAIECVAAPGLRLLLPEPTGFDPVVLEVTGRSGPFTWLLVPVGLALAVVAYRLPRPLMRGQARLTAALLRPTSAARLADRVDQLTSTRAATVDASATELRRIERDLHDGAQMRLVALSMNLGIAEDVFDVDPAGAKALLTEARAGAGAALTELRDLVRGIHPPVLADRGLAPAVEALTLGAPAKVELDLRLNRRLAAPVESAAYFAVAEALTNAIRHGNPGRIEITVVDAGTALHLTVRDDGRGGADASGGTGLLGIRRRLATFDGEMRLSSPPGGPTVLDMVLPCGS
jgi:signal transduction histidine kinase